jgi:nucleotide-binding universal stress UspA family protein
MIVANPFTRIVVGYDGSAAADSALRQAVALAQQYHGEVVVVHLSDRSAAAVLPIGTAAAAALDPAPVLGSLEPVRHDLFSKVSARVASCSVPVSMEFSMNAAAAGILDAVVRWNATAIAVGTHARTGVAHAFIRSVAEEVLRAAPVPVIVMREGTVRESIRRIVVGVDASEPSTNAMSFAVELGLGLEQRLRLLYCTVTDTNSILRQGSDASFDPMPMLSVLRMSARNALDLALQSANEAGLQPDTELTDAIDAGSGLCEVARRHDADAIVIGNHKRGKLESFFLGSTAEAVIHHADRPVIVVPAQPVHAIGAAPRVPNHA